MRQPKRIVAGVAFALAFANSARANSANWFVLDTNNNASAGYSVISGSTEGTTLEIERPAGSGTTRFTVVMRCAVTVSALKGYHVSLTSPQSSAINTIQAQTLNGFPIQSTASLNIEASAQANLVFNCGESELFNPGIPPGTTDDLLRFTFEIQSGAPEEIIEIFGGIGASGWDDGFDANFNPVEEWVRFGPNPWFLPGDPPVSSLPLIVVSPSIELVGDINGDGFLGLEDVAAFTDVLIGEPQAPEHVERSDVNGDGAADGLDISPFVESLTGG